MHLEPRAFQRRLEHLEKLWLVIDGENAFFFAALPESHTPNTSIQPANFE
jgi:hypothetical protein